MAKKELEIHEESKAQAEEIYDFYKDRFTNSGLYTWLTSELSGLHITVYNMAHELALEAQKSYHFERDNRTIQFIRSDH